MNLLTLQRSCTYVTFIAYWHSKAQMFGTAFHIPNASLMRGPITSFFKHHTPKTSLTPLASSSSSSSVPTMQQKKLTKDGVYIVNEMPPPLPERLNNSYYLLRHGQSWGNVEMVISSARSLVGFPIVMVLFVAEVCADAFLHVWDCVYNVISSLSMIDYGLSSFTLF